MKERPELDDILHRVEGAHVDDGSETYQGMELCWLQWRVVKVTPAGAWLHCIEQPWRKQRFALNHGARWVSRTKADALAGLVARKKRHIAIVEHQAESAREVLALAVAALAETQEAA